MKNSAQQGEKDSARGATIFSNVSFVAVAATVAVAALCLVPGLWTSQMVLPGAGRVALIVIVMVLGFSGVLVSTLLNLPGRLRRALVVLFATALLCSGFAALAELFAVSGVSSC
jgi:hypothetical protein